MLVVPVTISEDVDFPALLRTAINLEEKCEEVLSSIMLSEGFNAAARKPSSASQSRQHKKRYRVRSNEILGRGYRPSTKSAQKHLKNTQAVKTDLDTAKLPVASGARTALNKPVPQNPSEAPDIQGLIQSGFQYVSCGENVPRPIVDRNGLIIAHIAGALQDATYYKDAHDLFKIIIEESKLDTFSKDELNHKRGNFPAVNFGFTLPNGFKRPINLDYHRHQEKIDRIRSSPGFKRISAFQNAAFAFWNPGVYEYQKARVEQLLAFDPMLKRTSPTTIFPTTACNFRNVCCHKHRDTQNCPFGWCAITALGEFDHTVGGHLILWELKLIIEFPHGYTVLIPSATITHSNIPVADGDVRVSVTQYCSGSIFRYVENGFRTDKSLREQDKLRYDKMHGVKDQLWKMSLGLLSTLSSVKNLYTKST